jgi:N-acetylglucosamine kinase-like BadF-type ATPase
VREQRLGEIAPAVVDVAGRGDIVAERLVDRLAEEIVLLALKALRDLDLVDRAADVVLGGGMLRSGHGRLHDGVVERLRTHAPRATVEIAADPPVLGAALAALDAVGAPPDAGDRLRAAVRDGLVAESVA